MFILIITLGDKQRTNMVNDGTIIFLHLHIQQPRRTCDYYLIIKYQVAVHARKCQRRKYGPTNTCCPSKNIKGTIGVAVNI